jgi:hypothetical protein
MLNRPELKTDRRLALELLADAGPHGCTGAELLAHGFKIDILAELVRDGPATARRQPLKAGERQIEAALIRITDTGRRAIEEWRGGC